MSPVLQSLSEELRKPRRRLADPCVLLPLLHYLFDSLYHYSLTCRYQKTCHIFSSSYYPAPA